MSAAALLLALLPQSVPADGPPPASRPAIPTQKPSDVGISVTADRVAAIINDQVITESELETRLKLAAVTREITNPKDFAEKRRDILGDMIYQVLFDQAARARKIDDKQVDEAVRELVQKDEQKEGGPAALRRKIQSEGKSMDDWIRDLRSQELAQRLRRAEFGYELRPEREIVITPTLLRGYYRENASKFQAGPTVRSQQIRLTDAGQGSHEKAQKKMAMICEEIRKGADFSDLARKYSDSRAAAYGGDMGWLERGRGLEPPIEEFLFTHDAGAVSQPIELDDAIAIVKVVDKRPAGIRPFDDPETQQMVADNLYQLQGRKLVLDLRLKLLREAYVWPPEFAGR